METHSLPLTDDAVAERVLGHIRNGTTDMGEDVWLEPVANYRSFERLARELELLRRYPLAFCPSAALPDVGSYVARETAGVPLVVVRGEDRVVRAFRNVCRHRGMQVARDEGCTRTFVCGYHGWAYGLDGRLRAVPHEHGFPGLDKSSHGLVAVAAEECAGIVFVTIDEPAPGAALGDLPPLIAADQRPMRTVTRDTEANWKVMLEGFIEGYHIRATHPESFLPYGFDNLNVVETFGRHSRVTYPFQRIRKLEGVVPGSRSVRGLVTYVYHLFPNALVTVLSSHTNLVVLEPLGLGRTRSVNYTLTNGGGDPEQALAAAKRDSDFVGNTGAAEDRAVIEAIQRGIASGANEAFTFGRFEGAIVHFHKTLDAALAGLG
jgi:phenylpropionate dioxygenase-like ring-hydroxylating dioxygenase large terminal subunit